jgi:hypothetical protein
MDSRLLQDGAECATTVMRARTSCAYASCGGCCGIPVALAHLNRGRLAHQAEWCRAVLGCGVHLQSCYCGGLGCRAALRWISWARSLQR